MIHIPVPMNQRYVLVYRFLGKRRLARRLKDFDSAERMFRIKTLAYSGAGGVVGSIAFSFTGWNSLLGFIVGTALSYMTNRLITRSAVSLMETIHNPSGKSTPPKREYSLARAHQARGELDEAIAAWELNQTEFPDDPEPYIELARLYGNELNDFEMAISWFRRARNEADIEPGRALLATQEIIEIYTHKLKKPRRAVPELALLLERWPETPGADVARAQLAELREEMAREMEEG